MVVSQWGDELRGLQGPLGQRPCQLYIFRRSGCGIPESAVRAGALQEVTVSSFGMGPRSPEEPAAPEPRLLICVQLSRDDVIRDPDFCGCQYREPVAYLVWEAELLPSVSVSLEGPLPV